MSIAAGRSDAASPWASEPPMVPRLRTCMSAIVAATAETTPRSGVCSSIVCVVSAPTRQWPFWRSTPCSPGTLRRSTRIDGAARRSFISGISEWPPASSLASSPPSTSALMASCSDSGAV